MFIHIRLLDAEKGFPSITFQTGSSSNPGRKKLLHLTFSAPFAEIMIVKRFPLFPLIILMQNLSTCFESFTTCVYSHIHTLTVKQTRLFRRSRKFQIIPHCSQVIYLDVILVTAWGHSLLYCVIYISFVLLLLILVLLSFCQVFMSAKPSG